MPTYNPLIDRYLTVATVKTRNGQKDVRVVLDIDTNIFYTLDDNNNFIPIAYSLTIPDVFVSGGTYSAGTATFTNNTGGTFNVTGFVTNDTFATGYSYTNNIFTINQNNGQPNLTATIDSVTGLTSTGTIQSDTISATTCQNLPYKYEENVSEYISFLPHCNGLVNQIVSVNLMYWIPIFIERNLTISEVNIFIGGGVAGGSVIGLYDSVGTGLPNNLLFQTSAFNNAVVSTQSITLASPQTVNAGLYYIGYNSSSTATLRSAPSGAYINVLSSANANSGPYSRISKTFNYTGTLPPTFAGVVGVATKSISVNPHILFRISY